MAKKLRNLKTFEGFFGSKTVIDYECDTCSTRRLYDGKKESSIRNNY